MTGACSYIIFSNLYPPEGGGLERSAEVLARFLAGEKSHPVAVVFTGAETDDNVRNGVHCLSFRNFRLFHGFYPIIGPRMVVTAKRLIKASPDATVIIYGRHFTISVVMSVLCNMMGRAYVYVDTGFEPDNVFSSRLLNRLVDLLDRTVFRLVVKWAHMRIFVSRSSKDFVRRRYGRWVDDSHVILNGFNDDIISRYPYDQKENNVVFASRLVPLKNANTVAQAYLSLARRYPDWMFYLIGKGDCVLAGIADGLPENVIYQGAMLEQNEFHRLLSRSAIYINASSSEGLPVSAIEAGALGCLLTMSDIATNMELATVAGLEKYAFRPREMEDLAAKLELAIADSCTALHRQVQQAVSGEFSNTRSLERYWQLLG